MKKVEIVQLVFVILGVSIIFKILMTFIEQIGLFIQFSDNIYPDLKWIIIILLLCIGIFIIGYLMISRSDYFSRKIFKDDASSTVEVAIKRSDIIQLSVIILSLYFIVQLFPSFMSSLYTITWSFFNDFIYFKDSYPEFIWTIALYIFIVEVLIYSKKFSIWLESKLIK